MALQHTDKVSVILMASGFSRRFGGGKKLLFPFRGKPLARYVLDLVCGMNESSHCFSGIFFVAADKEVAALAEGLPVTLIRNTAPEKDIRESVRLGVEAACKTGYYFFFPCDQPLLDQETVRLILAARKPGYIAEPCFKDSGDSTESRNSQGSRVCQGSPSLFSSVFRDELLNLSEGEKPRVIKARHPEALISVEITNRLALFDIDTPEDALGLAHGN